MALDGTIKLEITYCVPWEYHLEAAWMASEFFSVGGSKLAITITPGDSGVLTVKVDGEKIFDKADGDGHPNLDRVKELKAIIKNRVAEL